MTVSSVIRGTAFLLVGAAALAAAPAVPAQTVHQAGDGSWNAPRVLELLRRTKDRRAVPHADSTLVNYRADARGYVYFYLERKGSEDRTLIRVDQLAVEVYWTTPNHSRQRIVGMRDESRLPNRMRYHLDHLVVVLDEFGHRIRLGDGDEVQDVPHPAAPGADTIYDYRLADSLSLRLPGSPEPVRVYGMDVRPRRLDRPAILGTLYVDRATADIVRMDFTFTPVSYVDRRLESIHVSLENGLWNGRHWLPHEQRLEIRREVPELDFAVMSVIRGTMRIGNYAFNDPDPAERFRGQQIIAVPGPVRQAFPFEQDLFAELEFEGLAPPPQMDVLRRQAAELARGAVLSGLPRLRLHLPDASSALRYNRAEGVFLGGGATYRVGDRTRLDGRAGYAFAAAQPSAAVVLRHGQAGDALRLEARANAHALRDAGLGPGVAGAVNTLLAGIAAEDRVDPYHATGLELAADRRLRGPWSTTLRLRAEEHRSMELASTAALFAGRDAFRPVRPVDEGRLASMAFGIHRTGLPGSGTGWRAGIDLETGLHDGRAYVRPLFEAGAGRWFRGRSGQADLSVLVGWAGGHPPAQRLFAIGGAGTVPGHAYRGFFGDRVALIRFETSHDLVAPWLRLRLLGAAGWTDFSRGMPRAGTAAAAWLDDGLARPSGGVRAGLGLGLGVLYDVGRFDLARGLGPGGRWQLIFSVHPSLRDFL